jgi:large subunit ribosomal protein L25
MDGAGERRRKVLIKDVQRDFLKGGLKHLDFLEVAMDHLVATAVPVVIHGEEQRRNQPGVIQHVLHSLEVSCLPGEIPEHVIVDVSTLDVGHSIHAGDLKLAPGIKVLTPPEDVVVAILSPTREKVEEQPGAEGVVPGVVGKSKAEEKEAKED